MAQQQQHSKKGKIEKPVIVEKTSVKRSAGRRQETNDVTLAERQHMIAERAYRIAEQRGFQGDMALNDWLQAENEVNARFAAKH